MSNNPSLKFTITKEDFQHIPHIILGVLWFFIIVPVICAFAIYYVEIRPRMKAGAPQRKQENAQGEKRKPSATVTEELKATTNGDVGMANDKASLKLLERAWAFDGPASNEVVWKAAKGALAISSRAHHYKSDTELIKWA
jgi:hypothetical protein